jgi:flagellar biosynthetic protein FlhB
MADAATRTERATPKRREAARRRGRVVVSPEIAPVIVLLAVIALASAGAPALVRQTSDVLRDWLAAAGPAAAGDGAMGPLAWRSGVMIAGMLGPFLLGVMLAGAGAVLAQVGWHPSLALVLPDARRIAVATGWARLVSLDGAVGCLKALVTVGLVAVVGWRIAMPSSSRALGAASLPVEGVLALAGGGLRELALGLAGALAVVAAGDYAWVRWRHEQGIKMSRHELREELRQSDGDPQVRRRFRRAHRDVAARRGLADVARADVVLASPGQVAVALRYRAEEGEAARVLAAGSGALAHGIEAAARAAGIPIVERRALARALVRAVPGGHEIPPAFYRAVGEVLAHVSAQGRGPEAPA